MPGTMPPPAHRFSTVEKTFLPVQVHFTEFWHLISSKTADLHHHINHCIDLVC